MIRTLNLTKEFDGFKAVDNLNLQVEKGDIYGFLGPNGAGKTTTINMILGLIPPTSGKVFLLGEELSPDKVELKRRIGVVSENLYFYKEMTAREYLLFFGELYQVPQASKRIEELLEALGLINDQNKKIGSFSKGMQQKLVFARALLHDPELLILDEPVANLDPNSIKQVRDLIEAESHQGKTVFISSHLLSEVERLCKKVAIINKGKLLAEDTMDNIRRRLTDTIEMEIELDKEAESLVSALEKLDFLRGFSIEGNKLKVGLKTDRDYRPELSRFLYQNGYLPLSMKAKEMSLEEAFITITQHNISLLAQEGEVA
ncbi:MAG TPA: ABC transporter ATP-binding protein [Candidatus Atribacteria bacterium]|nr:ABC transporter ATP-binding protein [Candidatus Atribacteria bacterium]HQE25959.1 ABC transporter ATP-binding protein [Candidatus Atribacteria bacterium]